MSRVKEDLFRKLVRELVRQELDEANSTASVGGSYNTPHAFGGSNKKGKGKGKAGYTGGHDEPTGGTGHFIADDPKLRKESIKEGISVADERRVGKFTIVILTDGGKMRSAILSKNNANKYNRNDKDVLKNLWDLAGKYKGQEIKESINEGRYHAWRNDDSKTPKQKIGMAMRETRDNLTELERIVRYNVRLKNELKVDSRDYWKNTHKALSKISERLVRLANKVGQLH